MLWLLVTLAFMGGLPARDLGRIAREHRVLIASGHLEATLHEWMANPRYWCDRPGCPRCCGWWGLS